MVSLTQWRWVWVNSKSWWWTGRPGVLQSMGSQRIRHDWATELSWIELNWIIIQAFPGGSDGKESTFNAGNPSLIPGSGRSPGEGNGNPLHCSCLENSMDRETWGPQSMGSQRVGCDWMTNTITAEAHRSRVGWPLRIWPQTHLCTTENVNCSRPKHTASCTQNSTHSSSLMFSRSPVVTMQPFLTPTNPCLPNTFTSCQLQL